MTLLLRIDENNMYRQKNKKKIKYFIWNISKSFFNNNIKIINIPDRDIIKSDKAVLINNTNGRITKIEIIDRFKKPNIKLNKFTFKN